MNKKMMTIGLVLALAVTAHAQQEEARQILKQTGVTGGLVVHVGCGDGKLTVALRASEPFVVQGLDADAANVAQARENIRAAGLYGPVSAASWDGGIIPYPDNTVRLLVISGDLGSSLDEMKRVICPGGRIYHTRNSAFALHNFQKPWPKEMDVWTHYFHDASNNMVSHDKLVAPSTQLRWMADPRSYRSHSWNKSIVAMITANGRVFYIEDRGPLGTLSTEFPEKWAVVCRDAFSGVELWTLPMDPKWGWREWEDTGGLPNQGVAKGSIAGLWAMPLPCNRRMIIDPKRNVLFMTRAYRAPISVVDATTGKVLRTMDAAGDIDEIIQAEDGTLILSARRIAPRKAPYGWTRKINEYLEEATTKRADAVAAMNPDTGAVLWKTEVGNLTPQNLAVRNGRVACYNYRDLICLDQQTGKELWRVSDSNKPKAKGNQDQERMWLRSDGCVVMYGDLVLRAGKTGTLAYEGATGKPVWAALRGGAIPTCFGVPGQIYIADGLIWGLGRSSVEGIDPLTGQVRRSVKIEDMLRRGHHLRCHYSRAADGTLCWSYLVAPEYRTIYACGRLESPWPVHGAVLVHDGKVYASAGRSTYLDGGIFVAALDSQTGTLLHQQRLDGPRPTLDELKKGAQSNNGCVMEGSLNDIFTLAGGRLFMLFQVFDPALNILTPNQHGSVGQRDLEIPHLIPSEGYSDTSMFNREFWGYSRYWYYCQFSRIGHWGVFDQDNFYSLDVYREGNRSRAFYTAATDGTKARLNCNPKTPPGGEKSPMDIERAENNDPETWGVDLAIVPRGLVQAGNRFGVVGIPNDGLKPEQAMDAALDKGPAALWVLDAKDGKKLGECPLPATCVFDGISSANGNLFAALVDGKIVCIGKP